MYAWNQLCLTLVRFDVKIHVLEISIQEKKKDWFYFINHMLQTAERRFCCDLVIFLSAQQNLNFFLRRRIWQISGGFFMMIVKWCHGWSYHNSKQKKHEIQTYLGILKYHKTLNMKQKYDFFFLDCLIFDFFLLPVARPFFYIHKTKYLNIYDSTM